MTYSPSIPKPDDDMSNSQADLKTNFQQLNTQFAVNHVAFDDDSADKGKHKFATFVQQDDDPETKADEYIIYAKDDDGDCELYGRGENNATPYKITKDGALFTGIKPIAAVNFDATPTIQGTSLNVASVTVSGGVYTVTFTTPEADNNYLWSVSAFDNSNNPCIATVAKNADYNSSVHTDWIKFTFVNQNNANTTIIRASVVLWRFQ